MDAWDKLNRELDCWEESGKVATLWWRDDDAVDITPQLAILLGISARYKAPIMLAVIPAHLTNLFSVHTFPHHVRLAQHGYRHVNHAPESDKKSEFGIGRDVNACVREITAGYDAVMKLDNAIPAFVPPWNRFSRDYLPILRDAGVRAISTFTARSDQEPVPGLRQVNTHADVMDWHGTRGYAGDVHVIGQLVDHLNARRTGTTDSDEPTGLLTHHLVHDDACWSFLEALFHATGNHPAARWLPIDEAMAA